MDENSADTILRHRRKGPIEIRDGAHTGGQKPNTEFPASTLGGLQEGAV